MAGLARIGDSVLGTTTGEHHSHIENPHTSPSTLTGTITSGSNKVFIKTIGVALLNSTTSESDVCGIGVGSVTSASSKIKINNVAIARLDDTVTPHNGTAHISSASDKVFDV